MTKHDRDMLRQRMELSRLRNHSVVGISPEIVLDLLDVDDSRIGDLLDQIESLRDELDEIRKARQSEV